jgi:hypothetical protein
LGIRQGAVTRPHRRPEEVGERGEPDTRSSAGEEPASERGRIDDRPAQPPARQPLDLAVQEREVEASVVADKDALAGKCEQPADGELRLRRTA